MSGLYVERKFSGSTTAGYSIDVVGSAMDAYAHHTLVDSNGALLLTDLQGTLVKLHDMTNPNLPIFSLQGVVGPSQSVILFDPQAHSYVHHDFFPTIKLNCLVVKKQILVFGMVVPSRLRNGELLTSATISVRNLNLKGPKFEVMARSVMAFLPHK
jgi:hypothetical protein